jgi:SET domain-containing protein
MNKTDEFSFRLKTSNIGGIGVFALHDIEPGTWLALKPRGVTVGVERKEKEIPKELLMYCIAKEDNVWQCPPEFNHMHLIWYLNHSDHPNAEKRDDGYYSIKDIKAGQEILIDYNILEEPEDKKEDFYRTT